MKITIKNEEEVKNKLLQKFKPKLTKTIEKIIDNIIIELPKGHNSSIADKLTYENEGIKYTIIAQTKVWEWLNYGTGIYNPEHAGKGPGGAIVPINAKALHFKNREISLALGFKDENVFLKKVKGIKPRFFYERNITENRILDILYNL